MCPICGKAFESPAEHLIECHSSPEVDLNPPWGVQWTLLETYSTGIKVKNATGRSSWHGRRGDLYQSVCRVQCFCGWNWYGAHTDKDDFISRFNQHIAAHGGLEAHHVDTVEKCAHAIVREW